MQCHFLSKMINMQDVLNIQYLQKTGLNKSNSYGRIVMSHKDSNKIW